MAKRLISTAVGILILALVFVSQNLFVINLAVTIVALIGLSEFYNAFKIKGIRPFETVGDLVTLGILSIGAIFAIRKFLMSSEERSISLSRLYNLKPSKDNNKEETEENFISE